MDILGHLGIFKYSTNRQEAIERLLDSPKGTLEYFIENNCLRIAQRFDNPTASLTQVMGRKLNCDIGFNFNSQQLHSIILHPIRITKHALEQYNQRADGPWPNIESLIKMQEDLGVDGMLTDNQFNPKDLPNFFYPLGSGGFIGADKVNEIKSLKHVDYYLYNCHWDKFQGRWVGEYVPEAHQTVVKTYIGPNEIAREQATFTQIDWYRNQFHFAENDKKWRDYLDQIN